MTRAARNCWSWGTVWAAAALALGAPPAHALINPNYTPVDLVNQSTGIHRLELGPLDLDKGRLAAKCVKSFRGKLAPKLTFGVANLDERVAKDLQATFTGAKTVPALMFAGDFTGASRGDAEADDQPVGALHLPRSDYDQTAWYGLYARGGGWLEVGKDPLDLKAVWAGGNDMLVRAVEYVLADPRADMPAVSGAKWAAAERIARIPGKVNGCTVVELDAEAGGWVHVLADEGDRLYRPTAPGGKLADATAALRLQARSKHAAWGDLDADGRADLASWDGKALSVHLAAASGAFRPKPRTVRLADCLSLAFLDAGGRGAGLLAATSAGPVLLTPDGAGGFRPRALAPPSGAAGAGLGAPGPCLVADFDGDALVDVLQAHERGVALYAGTAPGAFKSLLPAPIPSKLGPLAGAVCGDYDADGLLDVVLAGREGCTLLANLGRGRFREAFEQAGEVPYNAQPNVLGAANCDLNNDGRQDLLLLYPQMSIQLFFNRGFRCFGFAAALELRDSGLGGMRAIMEGQQAGAMADLNADGAQDAAVVARSGELWVLRLAAGSRRLGVTVSLPAGEAGPVNVVGYNGKRCLGARVVSAGRPASFGRRNKGPILLKWRRANRAVQSRRVICLKPTRFTLPAASK